MALSAKREKGELQRRLGDFLDLPRDVFLDLPKITLLGNMQLYIENHAGIIEYSPGIIRISSSRGEIMITGQDLFIETILLDEISIIGKIEGISLPN